MTTGICYYNSSSLHKPSDSSFGVVVSSKSFVNNNPQIFQVAFDTETNILTRSKSGTNSWTAWTKIVNGSSVNTLIANALTIDGKKSIPTSLSTLDDFDDMTAGVLVYSSATLNKPANCTNGLVISSKVYHTDQYWIFQVVFDVSTRVLVRYKYGTNNWSQWTSVAYGTKSDTYYGYVDDLRTSTVAGDTTRATEATINTNLNNTTNLSVTYYNSNATGVPTNEGGICLTFGVDTTSHSLQQVATTDSGKLYFRK